MSGNDREEVGNSGSLGDYLYFGRSTWDLRGATRAVRSGKADDRGGFREKIFLIEVIDK